jgi:hypothetical protein
MKCTQGKPQRQTPHGWIPPKPLGWNQLDQRQPCEAFSFDGTLVHDLPVADLGVGITTGSLVHYDTASMYYSNGLFWCVKYDAINCPVDDGYHESLNGNYTANQFQMVDWHRLGFNEGDFNKSTVAVPGRTDNLAFERRDQRPWTERIIPQAARAQPERRIVNDRRYAGLGGDLSLLVGLIVFSVRQARAGVALKQSIRSWSSGGWWCHGEEPGVGCNALPYSTSCTVNRG